MALMGSGKSGRLGVLGYYWFLTFAQGSELSLLAGRCQKSIASPYYTMVPGEGLHLTLDRVGYADGVVPEEVRAIEMAALLACREVPPFDVAVGPPFDVHGAIGLRVAPAHKVWQLRDALRGATLSVVPEAPVRASTSDPHVTIAYPAYGEGMRVDTRAMVGGINRPVHQVGSTVAEAALVLLERFRGSYSWEVVARIPLMGSKEHFETR
ncbi:2'-5' RNA ligase family protein [Nocardia blacklockiae]|uniref:2'-5' RNA ligase family protein n=1 Tax=Nocardia blacklockiae TaxID=480036 RepID=UPI001894D47F|nr:hypothetical protein [Nocardia blacklockiae]MBF6175574.1 hypothetical protein [Nocardia blacklockiae]